jgi:two-component system response regulator DctR
MDTGILEFSAYDRRSMIYTKEMLLSLEPAGVDGRHADTGTDAQGSSDCGDLQVMTSIVEPPAPIPTVDTDPPWTVLIVEDSQAVAVLHQRLVDAMPGFRSVGVVSDGESAYRAIAAERPDLAIVDLAMPGCDGRTLVRRLRTEGLPVEVVVVTASRDARTVREMLHLGIVDYLVKPFAPERLQHSMSTFARRARGLRRAQLGQDDVDIVQASGAVGMLRVPKGLKRGRLSAVRSVLEASQHALTAEEVGERIGVARVTARRYLDYLDVIGTVTVERECHGPGRPRNRYRYVRTQASPGRPGVTPA